MNVGNLKTILIVVSVVGGLLFTTTTAYHVGHQKGATEALLKWEQERSALKAAHQQEILKARATEQEMVNRINTLSKERQNEVARITARYERLINSLRGRPEARASSPSGLPDSSGPEPAGCTGAGLARGDAAFLARYAADSEALSSALRVCKAAYEEVRSRLLGASVGPSGLPEAASVGPSGLPEAASVGPSGLPEAQSQEAQQKAFRGPTSDF